MPKSKLEKLLLESSTKESSTGTALSQFGLEQITDVARFLKSRIAQWDSTIPDYDPLLEIAKLGFLSDKDDIKFRCHQELAKYQYPQIRSLEVQSKADKEVTVKIEMAGYAQAASQGHQPVDTEIEDIETEGDILPEEDEKKTDDFKNDYLGSVLKQSSKQGREL